MTAITAVVLTSTVFKSNVDATRFVEYGDWANIADAVAVSRAVAGDPIEDYQWADVIRLDVDNDGEITQYDVDIMVNYIEQYQLFDEICGIAERDWFKEMQDIFRMEMSETFNTPIQYVRTFYGFSPDEVVPYEPDCVMIDRIFTIADGGYTGYAIQEDPYFGDILYEHEYETGAIVVIYNVFVGGETNIVRQDEFLVGDTAEFGVEYTPRVDIVERALANIDIKME